MNVIKTWQMSKLVHGCMQHLKLSIRISVDFRKFRSWLYSVCRFWIKPQSLIFSLNSKIKTVCFLTWFRSNSRQFKLCFLFLLLLCFSFTFTFLFVNWKHIHIFLFSVIDYVIPYFRLLFSNLLLTKWRFFHCSLIALVQKEIEISEGDWNWWMTPRTCQILDNCFCALCKKWLVSVSPLFLESHRP